MKLQLTLIDDGIPFEDDNQIPVLDSNGERLGDLVGVQRFVGRSDIPLPHQVVLSFRRGDEAKQVLHYIWTKAFQKPLSWLKVAE